MSAPLLPDQGQPNVSFESSQTDSFTITDVDSIVALDIEEPIQDQIVQIVADGGGSQMSNVNLKEWMQIILGFCCCMLTFRYINPANHTHLKPVVKELVNYISGLSFLVAFQCILRILSRRCGMTCGELLQWYAEVFEGGMVFFLLYGLITLLSNSWNFFWGLIGSIGITVTMIRGILTVLLMILVWCGPFICLGIVILIRSGHTVRLDGTQPLRMHEDTRTNVEEAQSSSFHPRLGSFGPRLAELGRSVTRQLNASMQPAPNNDQAELSIEGTRTLLVSTLRIRRREASEKLTGCLNITVDREHILQQTLECLGSVPSTELMADYLTITFNGEAGVDGGGLRRDFFDCLGHNLVCAAESGDGHLMILPDRTLTPRPHETRFSDLYAIGQLAALAVWFGVSLPIPLGSVLCKFLMDASISPSDLQRLDPDFYQFRLKPILRPGGVDDLEAALGEPLMFVSAASDHREPKDLCVGGSERRVTEDNKMEYITLLCEHYLCGDMRQQINVLLNGFWGIFPKDDLNCSGLTYREVALLISGYSTLDLDSWRTHTEVSGLDQNFVECFWKMVGEMESEDRAKLLHFATGSSRLPPSGFAGLEPKFTISVDTDANTEHLPHSHTCANHLIIPRYASYSELVAKMKTALANDQGFGFM